MCVCVCVCVCLNSICGPSMYRDTAMLVRKTSTYLSDKYLVLIWREPREKSTLNETQQYMAASHLRVLVSLGGQAFSVLYISELLGCVTVIFLNNCNLSNWWELQVGIFIYNIIYNIQFLIMILYIILYIIPPHRHARGNMHSCLATDVLTTAPFNFAKRSQLVVA